MNISWWRYNNKQKFYLLRSNDTSSQNNEQHYLLLRSYVTASYSRGLPECCIVLLPAEHREYNECSHRNITEEAIIGFRR
jgi:hypothetical protein